MKTDMQPGNVKTLFAAEIAAEEIAPEEIAPGEITPGAVGLAWLGQGGFALKSGKRRIMIDPYLSDSLAEKYRGREFPHVRMMPSPIEPEDVHELDLVLCSHRHTDHMDPGTLPAIAKNNPACRFVIPAAERSGAIEMGLPEEQVLSINAGDSISPLEEIAVTGIPAAHEELKTNERGEHHFLGYILEWAGMRLYHCGDCVPYDGLLEEIRFAEIDLAMLPVNGRDEYRSSRGVLGNMTFEEAVSLCKDAGIANLIPHHFGMFDFNTVDPKELQVKIDRLDGSLKCVLPTTDSYFVLMR